MSKKPKIEKEVEEAPKKTPLVIHIVVFLLVTAIAAGAGFGVSVFLKPGKPEMANSAHKDETHRKKDKEEHLPKLDEHGDPIKAEGDGKEREGMANAYAKPLAPILTNLASPANVWVRMELAIVGEAELSTEVLEQIHQDLLAYMRTVKLHHVEGPTGYVNLKAELNERAAIRSGGAAKRVLVRTLVFE